MPSGDKSEIRARHKPVQLPSLERLKRYFDYDPKTGIFRWRTAFRELPAGRIAGTQNSRGYIVISFDGRLFLAHRLAWLWMMGEDPASWIDHINCDPADNRWANLRAATPQQNAGNRRRRIRRLTEYKGTSFVNRAKKWRAQIREDGQVRHLGYFSSSEEAHLAYLAKAREVFGEFARSK